MLGNDPLTERLQQLKRVLQTERNAREQQRQDGRRGRPAARRILTPLICRLNGQLWTGDVLGKGVAIDERRPYPEFQEAGYVECALLAVYAVAGERPQIAERRVGFRD